MSYPAGRSLRPGTPATRWLLASAWLATAAAAAGCVGTVQPGSSGNAGTPGTAAAGGAGGTGAGGAGGNAARPDPPGACTAKVVPWQTTMLTREQYIHAAEDLLGFEVRALATFADAGARASTESVALGPLQVEERQRAAEAIAAAAINPGNLARILPCDPGKPPPAACVTQFIERLGARAFRRPLDPASTTALRQLFDAGNAAGGPAAGVQWTVAGVLQSPDFLYQVSPLPAGARPGATVPLDDHALANRLAFFLWNSPPDADLRAAAAAGQLRNAAGIRAAATRMLRDPRARRMREDYHVAWLKLDDLGQVGRDQPEFSAALAQELRASLLEQIHHLYENGARVDALLGDSSLFMNAALARVYGGAGTGTALTRVDASPAERRGVLTHPALQAFLAQPDASDPIKRGVFVQEELLCQVVPDPTPDIPDLPPLRPGLSTRARLEQHRNDPACSPCHQLFDPIGMAFENYDAIGRYRKTDQGVPVDSSGEIRLGLDIDGKFASGMELVQRLAGSPAVRACLARRWFAYAVSRALVDDDSCALTAVAERFRSDGDLAGLLTAIAESETFRAQLVPQP